LFAPAIRIATEGFPISPRMATLLAADKALRLDPVAAAYFYDAQGKPWPPRPLAVLWPAPSARWP
jgi:gamma-glutamyltranspeptidase/glutathione hydrolase